ncbi:MAG: c-type cytochrome [Rhodanobacteraceae bacterium]
MSLCGYRCGGLALLLGVLGLSLLGAGIATRTLAAAGTAPAASTPATVERGKYLVTLGDCEACHTQPGQPAFSGGRPLPTPYGVFYPPNLTPDRATGIGNWTEQEFYRALHDGVRPDGAYLYPAFPFPSFTHLTRADVDAIWAYLRRVPAASKVNTPNRLHWPYSTRGLMKVWRALYFKPGTFKPDPKQSPAWNRGAYLVTGIAHCGACHTPRSRLGALTASQALAGGTITVAGWRAPNISQNAAHGIGAWTAADLRDFLHAGRSPKGDAIGPMRDVVQSALQHLTDSDLDAIVTYIKSAPARPDVVGNAMPQFGLEMAPATQASAKKLYHEECAGCHGDDGLGKRPYPDLRGNPIVLSRDPDDMVMQILHGGFRASTAASPYPYSMPPFGARLTDEQISHIASYVRSSWGNDAPVVLPRQVESLR